MREARLLKKPHCWYTPENPILIHRMQLACVPQAPYLPWFLGFSYTICSSVTFHSGCCSSIFFSTESQFSKASAGILFLYCSLLLLTSFLMAWYLQPHWCCYSRFSHGKELPLARESPLLPSSCSADFSSYQRKHAWQSRQQSLNKHYHSQKLRKEFNTKSGISISANFKGILSLLIPIFWFAVEAIRL